MSIKAKVLSALLLAAAFFSYTHQLLKHSDAAATDHEMLAGPGSGATCVGGKV